MDTLCGQYSYLLTPLFANAKSEYGWQYPIRVSGRILHGGQEFDESLTSG